MFLDGPFKMYLLHRGNQEGFSVFKRFFYAVGCYVYSLTLLGSFKVQYLMVHKRFESKCEFLL